MESWELWLAGIGIAILCVQSIIGEHPKRYRPMFRKKIGRVQLSCIAYKSPSLQADTFITGWLARKYGGLTTERIFGLKLISGH